MVLDSIRGRIQAHFVDRFNVRSVVLRTCAVATGVADWISMKIKSNGVNGLTNCMPDRSRIRLTLLGFLLGWFAYYVICDWDPSYSEPIFMHQWILNQSGVKARLTMDSQNNYTMDVMNLSELTNENPSLLFTEMSEGKSEKERVLTNLVGIGKTGNWGVHESKLRFSPKEQYTHSGLPRCLWRIEDYDSTNAYFVIVRQYDFMKSDDTRNNNDHAHAVPLKFKRTLLP